ncbi:hypothetical protein ACX80Z_11935 [Arthrobacter sp. TMT4-20]
MHKHLSLPVRTFIGLSVSSAIIAAGAGPAAASNVTSENERSDQSPPSAAETVSTIRSQATVVDKDATAGTLALTIPGELTDEQTISPTDIPSSLFEGEGDALINTELQHAAISTFATAGGTQSIIRIDSAAADTDYSFDLSLPTGATAAVLGDGSITISDEDGIKLGSVDAPWAYDANGDTVPTSFTVDGGTLIQTVDHSKVTAFPVVADPSTVWGWALCTASIGALVAGNLLIASKITKLGGVAKVVAKLKVAKNAQARYKALIAFFGEFTGIGAVLNNCK